MTDLAKLKQTIQSRTETPSELPMHLKAFVWWMLGHKGWEKAILAEAAAAVGAARLPDHAAAAGFAWHSLRELHGDPEPIRDCITWLSQRQYFLPNRPRALERDGAAMLGLSLAIRFLATAGDQRDWLAGLLAQAMQSLAGDTWEGSLILASQTILEPELEAQAIPRMKAEVAVALCEKRLIGTYADKGDAAKHAIATLDGLDEGSARAAVLLVALDRLTVDSLPARLANIEVEDVCRIAQGLPRAMKRWAWDEKGKTPRSRPGRWEVENEYHLQSLLWAVFAPIFSDLDDEEYLKSLGQLQPRCDLAIPSLNLIIEAKYVRPATKFSKVIGEIAEDVTLYLRHGLHWRHLVVVVWDDAARTEEHPEFIAALRDMDGIAGAVVIPRPSMMRRTTTEA